MSAQTILITGAAGHLGRAVAAAFQQQGARLVLVDRDAQALQRRFASASESVLPLALDLLSREQVHAGVQQALDRFGAIDVFCHIAGGFRLGEAVHETSMATWDFLMDLNARTLITVASAVVPAMSERRRGRVVAIGATAAAKAGARMGAYSASKSALIRLVEAMSAELKDQGINVNCVLPSIIDTPDNRAAMPDADASRWVAPQTLAQVIAFLASESAAAIHGAAIPVTGLVD